MGEEEESDSRETEGVQAEKNKEGDSRETEGVQTEIYKTGGSKETQRVAVKGVSFGRNPKKPKKADSN